MPGFSNCQAFPSELKMELAQTTHYDLTCSMMIWFLTKSLWRNVMGFVVRAYTSSLSLVVPAKDFMRKVKVVWLLEKCLRRGKYNKLMFHHQETQIMWPSVLWLLLFMWLHFLDYFGRHERGWMLLFWNWFLNWERKNRNKKHLE